MNRALMFATGHNAVGTPFDFFERLNTRVGGFGCDMAADAALALLDNWYGPDHPDPARQDCLVVPWPTDKPNFLNPPYGDPEVPCARRCKKERCKRRGFCTDVYVPGCVDFVRKAAEERERGAETWALLAARTDVRWFHEYVWDAMIAKPRVGVRVEFLCGRLKFRSAGVTNGAPFPSMLVRFHPGWR